MQAWARGLLSGLRKKGLDIQLVCPDSKLHSFPKDFKVHHILNDSEVDGLEPRKYYEDLIYLKELEQKADVVWTFDRSFPIKSNKLFATFIFTSQQKTSTIMVPVLFNHFIHLRYHNATRIKLYSYIQPDNNTS